VSDSDTSGICFALSERNCLVNKYGNCGFHGNTKPNEHPTADGNINNGSGFNPGPYSYRNSAGFYGNADANGYGGFNQYTNTNQYPNADSNVDTNQHAGSNTNTHSIGVQQHARHNVYKPWCVYVDDSLYCVLPGRL
jgi:hypothetical protein